MNIQTEESPLYGHSKFDKMNKDDLLLLFGLVITGWFQWSKLVTLLGVSKTEKESELGYIMSQIFTN